MKQKIHLFAFTVVVSVVMGLMIVVVGGKNIELVATARMPIYSDLMPDAESNMEIAVLDVGDRVDVLSCEDIKHYIVPKIRLADGRVGYVIQGQFEFIKTSPDLISGRPIVFSC